MSQPSNKVRSTGFNRSRKNRRASLFQLGSGTTSYAGIGSWVRDNVSERECAVFVLDKNKSPKYKHTKRLAKHRTRGNEQAEEDEWKIRFSYDENGEELPARTVKRQISFKDEHERSADDNSKDREQNKPGDAADKTPSGGGTRATPNVPWATVKPLIHSVQKEITQLPGAVDPLVSMRFQSWNPVCMCGKEWNNHSKLAQIAYREGATVWKPLCDTVTKPCDTFGEVEFVGSGQKVSKYIRVDNQTNMKTMMHMLQDLWSLPTPNLVISVTGGAQDFTMMPGLKEVFRRGLMKAAESTGAWIITAGTNAGVMKQVGEAFSDHRTTHGQSSKLVVLGVAPWGAIHDKELLIQHNGEGHWPVEYNSIFTSNTKDCTLEPNHTHFILVDDGTEHQYGTEISFRIELESTIAGMKTNDAEIRRIEDQVPIVCVVLEGGPGTLETVRKGITNGIPAVIVEGSGRTADILAYAYSISGKNNSDIFRRGSKVSSSVSESACCFDEAFWTKVKQKISVEWNQTDNLDEIANSVAEILTNRDYITIFKLDAQQDGNEIDVAILNALLKVNKENSIDQLKLALAWNRIDIAKNKIFTSGVKWEPGQLTEIMYLVIKKDRPEFVKLLIENGVSIKEFLTTKRLLQLYNDISPYCLLYQMLSKNKNKNGRKRKGLGLNMNSKYFSFRDVARVIRELVGDFFSPSYLDSENVLYKLDPDVILQDQDSDDTDEEDVFQKQRKVEDLPILEEPNRDLFIWSTLLHRKEMASLFWYEGKECLGAAMLGQNLLKKMKRHTDDSDLEKLLDNQISYFADLSTQLLSQCYSTDENKARMLLVRRMSSFGNTTVASMAREADNRQIIAHPACQTLLTSIWNGYLHPENSTFKYILCGLCPLLVCTLKFLDVSQFSRRESEDTNKVPEFNGKLSHLHGEHVNAILAIRKRADDTSSNLPWNATSTMSCWTKYKRFFAAPVIKFFYYVFTYLCLLGYYSVLLLSGKRLDIDKLQIFLIFWICSIVIEEARQIWVLEASRVKTKALFYLTYPWTLIDLFTLVTFFVGVILSILHTNGYCTTCDTVMPSLASCNLMALYFRLLHTFSMHRHLGPTLVMIGDMIGDMLYFMIILLVFIIGYGIAIQKIMYPTLPLSVEVVEYLMRRSFFQISGEFQLEEPMGEYASSAECPLSSNGQPVCPTGSFLARYLLASYVLVTNVLMLNLLIAMFSNTYTNIQQNADLLHKFQRYSLVKEFYNHLPVPPPFIIFYHVFLACRALLRCCCKRTHSEENWFNINMEDLDDRQLILWESINVEDCMRSKDAQSKKTVEEQLRSTSNELNKLSLVNEQISSNVGEVKTQQVVLLEELEEFLLTKKVAPSVGQLSEQPLGGPQRRELKRGSSMMNVFAPTLDKLDDRMTLMEQTLAKMFDLMTQKDDNKRRAEANRPASRAEASSAHETDTADQETDGKEILTRRSAIRRVHCFESEEEQKSSEARTKRKKRRRKRKHVDKKKTTSDGICVAKYAGSYPTLHLKARCPVYTASNKLVYIARTPVPDDFVDWQVSWPGYKPVVFTDEDILKKPPYADIDLMLYPAEKRPLLAFNKFDPFCVVNRRSYCGKYDVREGLPVNPVGRTGLAGRGCLGRWGPNHAADLVMTRWKKNQSPKVLEFISVQRMDTKEWAIPGLFASVTAEDPTQTVKNYWLKSFDKMLPKENDVFLTRLKELMRQSVEVYRGYMDDPRNTDNAWVETIAITIHDDTGLLDKIHLQPGKDVSDVCWMDVSPDLDLYANHSHILQKVVDHHNASC